MGDSTNPGPGKLGPRVRTLTHEEELSWIVSDIMGAFARMAESQRAKVAEAGCLLQDVYATMAPVPGGATLCGKLKFALREVETVLRLIDEAQAP